MAWIDQHCHIDPGPDGVAQVAEANAAGVMRMVSVGCDLEPRCQSGETPLVKAARTQAMRAYKFLLEHGTPHAEIEHRNREDDNARQLIIDNTRHWHISGGASVEYTK